MPDDHVASVTMVDRLEKVHGRRLDAQAKRRVRPLLEEAERLPRRDASGAVYLDRRELERWIAKHGRERVSPGLLRLVESLPGAELVRTPGGDGGRGGRRITWDEFLGDVTGGKPFDPFKELGLARDATPAQLRAAVERKVGRMPDELFDQKRAPDVLARGLAAATRPARTVTGEADQAEAEAERRGGANDMWECLLGQLPWWASIAFILAIITIVATLVVSGGTFAAALALGMETFFAIFGGAALIVFVTCFVQHILATMFPH